MNNPLIKEIDYIIKYCAKPLALIQIRDKVVEVLKKYKSSKLCCLKNSSVSCYKCYNEFMIFFEIGNRVLCFNCWFEECFGELPNEKECKK